MGAARNHVKGRSIDAIRAEIDVLQTLRRAAGLTPLIVSTDQYYEIFHCQRR